MRTQCSISLDEVLELAGTLLFDYIFVISLLFSSVLSKSLEDILSECISFLRCEPFSQFI